MSAVPDIPSAYELIALDSVDSTLAEAKRRVAAGAEEGTLIYAQTQTAAHTRTGEALESPPGNLYCALIFRPQLSPRTAVQLNYVAAVSLGTALASLVAPLIELKYRWPNLVLLQEAIAGEIDLHWEVGTDALMDWLIADIRVNVATHPVSPDFTHTSLAAEGCPDLTPGDVLEQLSRQLLAWLNRWSEEDFAPVRQRWLERIENRDDTLLVPMPDGAVSGAFDHITDDGDLVVLDTAGLSRRLSLTEFWES